MRNIIYRLVLIIIVVSTLSTCGGGGGDGAGTGGADLFPSMVLTWDPPTEYVTGESVVSTLEEIGAYRIYVKTATNFSDADNYVEVPAVLDNQVVSTYDLKLSASFFGLKSGVQYYVAMRVVSAVSNEVSDFSTPGPPFSF